MPRVGIEARNGIMNAKSVQVQKALCTLVPELSSKLYLHGVAYMLELKKIKDTLPILPQGPTELHSPV